MFEKECHEFSKINESKCLLIFDILVLAFIIINMDEAV